MLVKSSNLEIDGLIFLNLRELLAYMTENVVMSSEFNEWTRLAETPHDVLAMLEEFRGKGVFLLGWRVVINVKSVNMGVESPRITLEATCLEHPDTRHQQQFPIVNGEVLYCNFLDMVEPYRRLHPYHE